MIQIEIDRKSKQHLKLMKELPKRIAAMERYLVHEVATGVHADILRKLPKGADYAALRDALEVARGKSAAPVYAVRARPSDDAVGQLDVKKTAIYVRARKRMFGGAKDIAVLEEYGPWTVDTLPYKPSERMATLVYRKSSAADIKKLKKQKLATKSEWTRKLEMAGAKLDRGLDLSKMTATQDYAFDSLNLEFGLGRKEKPHWRPALARVTDGSALKRIQNGKAFKAALYDPKSTEWKTWHRLGSSNQVDLRELRQYKGFQDKLGVTP